MKFKRLILTVLLIIAVSGISFSNAQAADGINPWIQIVSWSGYVRKDKYSSGIDQSETKYDAQLYGTCFGLTGTYGNLILDGSVMSLTDTAIQLFMGSIQYRTEDWNIAFGRLGTPYSGTAFNNVANWDLFTSFSAFEGFPMMIKGEVKGIYLLIMQPVTGVLADPATPGSGTKLNILVPKLAAGYEYGNPVTPFSFDISGVFQTYKYKNDVSYNNERVTAYSIGATFTKNNGAGGFGFNIHAQYVVNGALLGYFNDLSNDPELPTLKASGGFDDAVQYGGHAGVSYVFGNNKIAAGAGYKVVDFGSSYDKKDPFAGYFAIYTYNINPKLRLGPSILILDGMKDRTDAKEGKTIHFGIHTQANI